MNQLLTMVCIVLCRFRWNTSFKSYDDICWSPLPSFLDQLSMDKKDSDGLLPPCTCTRGKVIRCVIVVLVMDTIAKSGDVGVWASCKRNKSVEFGEKVASVCLESSDMAYKHHITNNAFYLAVIATPINHAYYALCIYFLLMHTIVLGKDCRQHYSKLQNTV